MRKVTIQSTMVGDNPNMDDMPAGSYHYRCTLRYKGRQMTVPFSMGPALCREPTVKDVLSCLFSDASTVENCRNFDEWCADLGYDADSRRAERTFRVCEIQARKLRQFCGEDFDELSERFQDR